MILDKKFKGILDAGAGCLIVYEDQSPDHTYEQALETLGNMSKVVDALYVKANQISAPPVDKEKEKKEKEEKEKEEKEKKEKEKKGGKDDAKKKQKK